MPKLNAVLMAAGAVAMIVAMGFLALRSEPARELEPAQLQKLLRKLGDPDPDIRREGEAAFRGLGTAAIAPLREASRSTDRPLAERAASLLQELQPASPVATPGNAPATPAPQTE